MLDTSLDGLYDEQAQPAEARNYDPLPKGEYLAVISESEVKPTSDNTGKRLALTIEVLEPEAYAGRKIFAGVNLLNKSQLAQEIGQREMAALRAATGVNRPKDSTELHGIPFVVAVKIRPERTDLATGRVFEKSNGVTGYKPAAEWRGGQAAPATNNGAAPAGRPMTSPAAPPAAAGRPPFASRTAAPAAGRPPFASRTAAPATPARPPFAR
jgi:hypothetical protein